MIRDFTMDDVESFSALAADPEVTRFLYWGPYNTTQTRQFVRKAVSLSEPSPRRKYLLVIEDRQKELLGYIHLNIKSFINAEAEITYCLQKKYWGQGLGSEAVRAVLKYSFEKLHLHRVFARIDEENVKSAALLKKNGFVYEGKLRQDAFMKGQWRDSLIFSVLSHEFLSDQEKSV